MKYLFTILIFFFASCTLVNEASKITFDVFSNYPHFTVTFDTAIGEREEHVFGYEWKRTIVSYPGDEINFKVVGDSVQVLQVKIHYDSVLLFDQIVEDSIPIIEFKTIL